MTHPYGELLEGLLEGGMGGYQFREGIKDRRRSREQEDEERRLRRARGEREQVVFDRESDEYNRATRLRREVGDYLAAPVRHRTLGSFISGQPGARDVPLSDDARVAQSVGEALGRFGGRDVSDEEALLLGSGMVPHSAVRPRTRTATRTPITLDQAMRAVDRMYGVWDEATQTLTYPNLTPGQRHALAQKLYSGTATEADFPPERPPQPGEPEPVRKPGVIRRIWEGLFGSGDDEAAPPRGGPPATGGSPPPPRGGRPPTAGTGRVDEARALLSQYADLNLPPEELEALLADEGFTPEEIALILGGVAP